MDGLVNKFSMMSGTAATRANDYYDRLSSSYSVVILVIFATFVGFNSYIGAPINCWLPAHFHDSHCSYANQYCWVRNTYFLPWEQYDVPREGEERAYIYYYQWITFILLGQACLFFIPCLFWNGLNQKAGIDADNIISSSLKLHQTETMAKKEKLLGQLINHMDRMMKGSKGYVANINVKDCGKIPGYFCGRGLGSYLTILFLVSKILYITNVIAQLFLLNSILSAEYNLYGFDIMTGMLAPDHEWDKSGSVVFPRVTMCDFKVRRLGNIHRYTVQCVLPINLYTEKIYVFLWFWMVFVAAMTVLGFFSWLIRMIWYSDKVTYIKNHLPSHKESGADNDYDEFISEYLRQDGVFLLRLIGHNTNNITVTEITEKLWEKYDTARAKNHRNPSLESASQEKLPLPSDEGTPMMQ